MWPLGHAGLTLATSLGACVNAALLFLFLRRNGFYEPRAGWLVFLSRLVVALGVLAAVAVLARGTAEVWLAFGLWERVGRLFGVIAAGAASRTFGALFLLGFRLRGLQPAGRVRRPIFALRASDSGRFRTSAGEAKIGRLTPNRAR